MKKTILFFAIFFFVGSLAAQVRPDQQTTKTPADTDAIYTQEDGSLKKVLFSVFKEYVIDGTLDSLVLSEDSILVAFNGAGAEIFRDTITGTGGLFGVVSDATLTGDGTSESPLSVLGTLTDDQIIDVFTLASNTLSISLESDGEPVKTVDLSSYLDNTDDQIIDVFTLASNTLSISLESDGEPVKTVDLSSYLDNTDTQDLGYTASTGELTLVSGGSVSILVSAQYTEEVFSGLTTGNTVTITGDFPSNLDGVIITRGGMIQREGASFDYTILGKVVTFEARNFEHGETVIIKYPN